MWSIPKRMKLVVGGAATMGVAIMATLQWAPRQMVGRRLKGNLFHTFTQSNDDGQLWMAVLSKDVSLLTEETWDFLMAFHCSQEAAHVHVVVPSATDSLALHGRRQHHALYQDHHCGEFHVLVEPENLVAKLPNRIDRIAHLRDLQRHSIQDLTKGKSVDAVIVVDGDLHSMPNPALAKQELQRLVTSPNQEWDVLCATGVSHDAGATTFGYYDTFATLLWPNTWLYPLEYRLVEENLPQEDPAFVFSSHGMTSRDFLQHLQSKALKLDAISVKSCFGGMAMYRGSVWLETTCDYTPLQPNLVYANRQDERTCEHVTFHQCLREERPRGIQMELNMGIHPHLITEYHDVDDKRHRNLVWETAPRQDISACPCPMQINVLTDDNPEETSWELRNKDIDLVLANVTRYDDANILVQTDVCLVESGNYSFVFFDAGLDGLTDGAQYNYTLCDGTSFVGAGDEAFEFQRSSFEVVL